MKQLNNRQIEMHLKSAVDALTPNVLDRIDLSVPQIQLSDPERQNQAVILRLQRRMRGFAAVAAVCVCLVLAGGGTFHYHMENRRVESVIGLDVNPSVELSINRREQVLEARALNADAEEILDGMDLKGVELNVAVNAVVGSMVTHGYLNDLDNAILVTVSNDSVRKAKELRASVVDDIERTLQENQVEAVVYDQQVIEDEEMEALARQYGISYGKAYFLKELIEQNDSLSMEEMEKLSSMTMEEIARRIAEDSYELGELADRATEPETIPHTEEATEPESAAQETSTEESSTRQPESSEETLPETTGTTAATAAPETTKEPEEEAGEDSVEIDYVDCEGGLIYVYFKDRIKWKNPSVVVRDEEGNSYAAIMDETSRNECSFEVSGLEEGENYIFVLGGLSRAGSDVFTTVTGYFESPDIDEDAWDGMEEDPDDETEDDRETKNETWPSQEESSREMTTEDEKQEESQETESPDEKEEEESGQQ